MNQVSHRGTVMNIFSKLVITGLILLLVPSLIIGIVSYFSAKNSFDERGAIQLKNGVKTTYELIHAYLPLVEAGQLLPWKRVTVL